MAELSFPSREAFMASRGSPEAQAATADVPNFATGGVTIFIAYD
ncbi:MAG: EthD family reductase [Trebonia sp.]